MTPQLRALLSLHNETLTCKPSGVTRRDVTLFLILLPYGIDLHFLSLSLSLCLFLSFVSLPVSAMGSGFDYFLYVFVCGFHSVVELSGGGGGGSKRR